MATGLRPADYFTGVLSDATKSVSRAYINNFQDKAKQQAIDMFLVRFSRHFQGRPELNFAFQGNLPHQNRVTVFDPIHDSVQAALLSR